MRIIVIPADESKPLEELDVKGVAYPHVNKVLADRQEASGHLQGQVWIERVSTPWLHALANDEYNPETREGGPRYPSVIMIVDEEGRLKHLRPNRRASVLYGGIIAGDAVLCGERNGREGPEFAGLPAIVTTERVAAKVLDRIAAILG